MKTILNSHLLTSLLTQINSQTAVCKKWTAVQPFAFSLVTTALLCVGFVASLSAQSVNYTLVNDIIGVDHVYSHVINMGGGVAIFDYDNDGDEDFWMTGGLDVDELYENNGDGTFSKAGTAAGLAVTDNRVTNAVISGDIDNDGDRDVFITTNALYPNVLMENNGDGTFTDISLIAGIQDTAFSTTSSFGDFNLDGYLDIYVGNYVFEQGFLYDSAGVAYGFAHRCSPNWLYMNNGDNSFTEMAQSLGVADTGCILASAWTDFDNDADVDLLMANDFGEWIVPNRLYENTYPGTVFNDISVSSNADAQQYGMGIAVGDYDHDLDLDYYTTNIGLNHLYKNDGSGAFEDATFAAGVEDVFMDSLLTIGWGTAFLDIDNDSWLDLFVSNGHIPSFEFISNSKENHNRLFYNNGDGTFSNIADSAGVGHPGIARGFACADYDQDGDVDLVVMSIDNDFIVGPDQILVYRNDSDFDNNWLNVSLEGTYNNRDAFGSHIEISVNGSQWVHEVTGGSSYSSQNSSIAHFGLGVATVVDEILVTWPGGEQQLYSDIAINQMLHIVEDSAAFLSNVSAIGHLEMEDGLSLSAFPNPIVDQLRLAYALPTAGNTTFELYDEMGRLINRWSDGKKGAGNHSLSLDMADYAAGLYQLRLVSGTRSAELPLIKL